MPYRARAREHSPVAVPVAWEELLGLDGASHWHVGEAAELLKRAASKALVSWGRADQVLPNL